MGPDFLLKRIANNLIINASFLKDLGLYHGKMGIALFFAHYSRYTGMKLYDDFAGILIDEIYEEIHTGYSIDLENGLSGIGWGIEYLLQNNFMTGNSFLILRDIDERIKEYDLINILDKSVKNGLAGISCYLNKHLNYPIEQRNNCSFDEAYIARWSSMIEPFFSLGEIDLESILESNVFNVNAEVNDWKLGLENGCSGFALKMILK